MREPKKTYQETPEIKALEKKGWEILHDSKLDIETAQKKIDEVNQELTALGVTDGFLFIPVKEFRLI